MPEAPITLKITPLVAQLIADGDKRTLKALQYELKCALHEARNAS